MGVVRVGFSVISIVAVIAAALAAATIWLLLTDPVTVADAVNQGDMMPLVTELAGVLFGLLKGLLGWL